MAVSVHQVSATTEIFLPNSSYSSKSREVRQIHLHCENLGVLLRDVSCAATQGKLVTPVPRSVPDVFFLDALSTWSLDGNAYAHAQCHTHCVLRPMRRAW